MWVAKLQFNIILVNHQIIYFGGGGGGGGGWDVDGAGEVVRGKLTFFIWLFGPKGFGLFYKNF